MFVPERIYFEKGVEQYPLGRQMLDRYAGQNMEIIKIENHNMIPELRERPDSEFVRMKKYLILGIRKSLRLVPNTRSADFIVPFTSSGCSAMCLYCYLLCTFFKGSYLRIFVNREEMMDSIRKKAKTTEGQKVYEIGSNSDMVLENTITGNLEWAILKFAELDKAMCTFATKFADVDGLLGLEHRGKTQVRISVNPTYVIKKVEIGTAKLSSRIEAANKLYNAGYKVGINIAPIILLDDWKELYSGLFDELETRLDPQLKRQLFFELIFMTYGLANDTINSKALPGTLNVFEKYKMRTKGRGKYCYRDNIVKEAREFMLAKVASKFPDATVSYIV